SAGVYYQLNTEHAFEFKGFLRGHASVSVLRFNFNASFDLQIKLVGTCAIECSVELHFEIRIWKFKTRPINVPLNFSRNGCPEGFLAADHKIKENISK